MKNNTLRIGIRSSLAIVISLAILFGISVPAIANPNDPSCPSGTTFVKLDNVDSIDWELDTWHEIDDGTSGIEVRFTAGSSGDYHEFDWKTTKDDVYVEQVYIKAGNEDPLTNTIGYDPAVQNDFGLAPAGKHAISHINFCYLVSGDSDDPDDDDPADNDPADDDPADDDPADDDPTDDDPADDDPADDDPADDDPADDDPADDDPADDDPADDDPADDDPADDDPADDDPADDDPADDDPADDDPADDDPADDDPADDDPADDDPADDDPADDDPADDDPADDNDTETVDRPRRDRPSRKEKPVDKVLEEEVAFAIPETEVKGIVHAVVTEGETVKENIEPLALPYTGATSEGLIGLSLLLSSAGLLIVRKKF
jgi:hypothetical protein